MRTDEQIFLDWCKENKILWKNAVSYSWHKELRKTMPHWYELNSDRTAVLIVQGHTFKLNESQNDASIVVHFSDEGKWEGGTNLIWNQGLPWEDVDDSSL
jgi:hypothetical protein